MVSLKAKPSIKNNDMNTTEIFKRFAVFANKQGVLKQFSNIQTANAAYMELKAWADTLPDTGRLIEIDDFVFGQDVDKIENHIKSCMGYFMLVEYGPQQTPSPDRERNRVTEQNISVIIAKVANTKNWDLMMETVENNAIEEMIYNMANLIAQDDKHVPPFKRLMDKNISISPVEPSLLFGAVGWQMAFKVQSYKMA